MDYIDYIDNILDEVKIPIYRTIMVITHIAYAFALFGIIMIDPIHVNKLNIFAQLFVCGFLIIRFHPFRSHELRKYDSQIIFGSALFLLANLGITQYFLYNVKTTTVKLNKFLDEQQLNLNNRFNE